MRAVRSCALCGARPAPLCFSRLLSQLPHGWQCTVRRRSGWRVLCQLRQVAGTRCGVRCCDVWRVLCCTCLLCVFLLTCCFRCARAVRCALLTAYCGIRVRCCALC
eukprot:scaffold2480_cov122-Isochrysis_galbana.AAC.2